MTDGSTKERSTSYGACNGGGRQQHASSLWKRKALALHLLLTTALFLAIDRHVEGEKDEAAQRHAKMCSFSLRILPVVPFGWSRLQ